MPEKSMIGAYGDWAASLAPDPGTRSLRSQPDQDVDAWRAETREYVSDRLARPETGGTPVPRTERTYESDGLHVEELTWELPYGPPTDAVFLRPANATGPLPGVLGLHDHGGQKYFGHRKIADTDADIHPTIAEHREQCYGGRAWANELAKQGYAVLVHDAFAFASRRVRLADVPTDLRDGTPEPRDDDPASIDAYDAWAAAHESTMAKSLFAAGTTWPGVFLAEDQRALDVLCDREEVDDSHIGCAGLSGGGLRTVFLGGMDPRIDSAVCAGMMTTWRDYARNKSATHTWMCYLPGCPSVLDYSEVLGLRVPAPTLVLNNHSDPLFTHRGMERADEILSAVYDAAGTSEAYECRWYDGEHKFDREMQVTAFDWFEDTLS